MKYDLFICHASEDKDEIVRPLALNLKNKGAKVWYDEFSLNVGDSLSEKIDHGLLKSRYGILILSENFFNKKWTKRELRGLVSREIYEDDDVIIPVWHNITIDDVINFSPPLADRFASMSNNGIDSIVNDIIGKIGEYEYTFDVTGNLKKSSDKILPTPANRKCEYQLISTSYIDKIRDKDYTTSIEEKVIYPYSNEIVIHSNYWQTHKGELRVLRHTLYDYESGVLLSCHNEIDKNDGYNIRSVIRHKLDQRTVIRSVSEISTTNHFKSLFSERYDYLDINHGITINRFSYQLIVPKRFSNIEMQCDGRDVVVAENIHNNTYSITPYKVKPNTQSNFVFTIK